MKFRQLGDLKVSELFFGTMRYLRAPGGGAADMKVAEATLDEALDSGINVIHSSFEYDAQEQTGEFLRGRAERQDLLHMVKCPTEANDLTLAGFGRWLDGQLTVLRAQRIAILQIRAGTWEEEAKIFDLAAPYLDSGKIMATSAFAYDDDFARGRGGWPRGFAFSLCELHVPLCRRCVRFAGEGRQDHDRLSAAGGRGAIR